MDTKIIAELVPFALARPTPAFRHRPSQMMGSIKMHWPRFNNTIIKLQSR